MSDAAPRFADPFDLLVQIESQVRAARLDVAAGQAQNWVGLGFGLGEHWLVTPKDDVREVITVPTLTRVPGAKPWLLGLANVRGGLLPVCDLRRLLETESASPPTRNSRVLVYNSERRPAGFLVDEVAGYRQFTPAEQDRDARATCGLPSHAVVGAFARDGQTWLAVSLHRIATVEAFLQAGAN